MTERFCGEDLMGVRVFEVVMGVPWKNDDLFSKKEGLGLEERDEVRVVDMVAI